MRYLWDLYPAYLHEWTQSPIKRSIMAALANYLRLWDSGTAARVDRFLANSRNVQNRIWKAYRRTSQVIHPPVSTEQFYSESPGDYWLVVSELVAYKRIVDAVRCFTRTGRKLKVVGDGPEYRSLKEAAGPTVEFCGRVPDNQLANLYARCRALVMPGEEDFGMVAVEALASGKPVIALGKGGVLESVPTSEPRGGFFYDEPGERSLEVAIEDFERAEDEVRATALQSYAVRFSRQAFEHKIQKILLQKSDLSDRPSLNVVGLSASAGA
jgi:glycosyltransferase involved in cell wall biosynthesis